MYTNEALNVTDVLLTIAQNITLRPIILEDLVGDEGLIPQWQRSNNDDYWGQDCALSIESEERNVRLALNSIAFLGWPWPKKKKENHYLKCCQYMGVPFEALFSNPEETNLPPLTIGNLHKLTEYVHALLTDILPDITFATELTRSREDTARQLELKFLPSDFRSGKAHGLEYFIPDDLFCAVRNEQKIPLSFNEPTFRSIKFKHIFSTPIMERISSAYRSSPLDPQIHQEITKLIQKEQKDNS